MPKPQQPAGQLPQRERKKVSRACDACKSKKARCSGTQPCVRCARLSTVCSYYALYTRGRAPWPLPASTAVTTSEIDVVHLPRSSTSASGSEKSPRPSAPFPQSSPDVMPSANSLGDSTTILFSRPDELEIRTHHSLAPDKNLNRSKPRQSMRNSPEPGENDLEGHYLGSTSSINFLVRARKRLRDLGASRTQFQDVSSFNQSSIFTFGDPALPDISGSTCDLPSEEYARELVERYFHFAMPTYRFLHRNTVEQWLTGLYRRTALGDLSGRNDTHAEEAVLMMIFAVAMWYRADASGAIHDSPKVFESSDPFFQAAQLKLSNERGPITLTSIQARLCQCLYLLGQSRINYCWTLFGTTAHLALALGLQRRRSRTPSDEPADIIDHECRKRVFWSLYKLDTYLSVMLGRPRTLQDEDIDQEYPKIIDDNNLGVRQPSLDNKNSVMLAAVAHMKLARIVSRVQRQLYPIHSISEDLRLEIAREKTQEIHAWREELPAFIDSNKIDPSMLIPLFRRQSTMLELTYCHALILANRPSLLASLTMLTRNRWSGIERYSTSIDECIKAALIVVQNVHSLIKNGNMLQAFWFTQYVCFCAVVVLYVYAIQQNLRPRKSGGGTPLEQSATDAGHATSMAVMDKFAIAEQCQHHIASATKANSLGVRYNIILEELRLEVHRQTEKMLRSSSAEVQLETNGKTNHKLNTSSLSHDALTNTEVERQLEADTITVSHPINGDSTLVPSSSDQNTDTTPATGPDPMYDWTRYQQNGHDLLMPPSTSGMGLMLPDNMADILGWGQFDAVGLDSISAGFPEESWYSDTSLAITF